MTRALRAKVGDTMAWASARTDDAGDAVSLSGVTIAAFFERGGTSIVPSVNILDASGGTFELAASAAVTADWVPGVYRGDVTFTDGLGVQSTETFAILVERGYP